MTDFLTRVAARAVGQPASVRPRLPALFEPSEPTASGIELAETETEMAPLNPHRSKRGRDAPARAIPGPVAVPRSQRPKARPPVERPELETIRDRPELQTIRERENRRELETVAEVLRAPTEPEPVRAEAGPVAAIPAIPAVASTRAPQVETGREDAPAVRVHIGRLEVRATLPAAPPPRPAAERPAPRELSLGDYLRGERAVR